MRPNAIRTLAAMTLFCFASLAQAAITCTAPVVAAFSTAINAVAGGGASVVPNITQGSVSFTCSRSAAGDATTVLLRATNGANPTGVQNRARLGATANYIAYEFYDDSGCSSVWTSLVAGDMIVVNLASILSPPNPAQSFNINYWGCITVAPVVPAGTYTDTVGIRVRNNTNTGNLSPNTNVAVSIVTPATCSVTSITDLVFPAYLAFRNTSLSATNATITLNCTVNLPYSMSFDAALGGNNGVVAGLNYALTINGQSPPVTSRGTGPGQTHTLGGTMPANQAGTCATGTCGPTSQLRTLTITY